MLTIVKAGNKLLEVLAALLIVLLLLYGGYSLWDTWQVNHRAFAGEEIMKYKPTGDTDGNPSLSELQQMNPDVCAWLTVDGTHIDYPVVQGKTNLEYLNKDIYGEFALSGSIFLDNRNNRDFTDSYSLLYGHHMENGAMFGDVTKFREKDYFEKHRTGTLYLSDGAEVIQWFACVETDAYDSVIYNPENYGQENQSELLEYIQTHAAQYEEPDVLSKSKKSEDLNDSEIGSQWKILGLSTCLEDQTNGRAILFGIVEQ